MTQIDLTQLDMVRPRRALQDALIDGRLLSVLLSCSLIFNMVDPALLIVKEPVSLVSNIARMTHHPVVIASLFLLMAALAAPFMLMQTFAPRTRHRRRVIRLGCLALCCGGLLWVFLAYLSRSLDYATVTGIFIRNGIWNIALAAVLANSINNEQKRASDGVSP